MAQHPRQRILDLAERADHLADALAGDVLEIARFVDRGELILDVVGEPGLVAVRERGAERPGVVVDDLGRLQDLVGRRLHDLDGGAELARRARHAPLAAFVQQARQFVGVLGDGVAQARKLAREGLRVAVARGRAGRHRRARGERRARRALFISSIRKSLRCTVRAPRPNVFLSVPTAAPGRAPPACSVAAQPLMLGCAASNSFGVYRSVRHFTQNKR